MATATEPKANRTTDLALSSALTERLPSIEQIGRQCYDLLRSEGSGLMKSLMLANGVRELKTQITDEVMRPIMYLMNSPLGFLTDQNPATNRNASTYDTETVKECFIESLIRGFQVTGNEWNIIAGRFYGCKNGYRRLVTEWPGLTELRLQPGVPVQGADPKTALVPYVATWKLEGKPQRIECVHEKYPDGSAFDGRIPVRVNAGMSADAVLGKAERKILARIYGQLTGLGDAPEGDAEDAIPTTATRVEVPVNGSKSNRLAAELAGKAAPPKPEDTDAYQEWASKIAACEKTEHVQYILESELPVEVKCDRMTADISDALWEYGKECIDQLRADAVQAESGEESQDAPEPDTYESLQRLAESVQTPDDKTALFSRLTAAQRDGVIKMPQYKELRAMGDAAMKHAQEDANA